ncbi:MAG TPA: hypothetical protein VLQ65_07115 [Saliniramus sp.]|nr:hypothetical protein [Saliniramus sp.]
MSHVPSSQTHVGWARIEGTGTAMMWSGVAVAGIAYATESAVAAGAGHV